MLSLEYKDAQGLISLINNPSSRADVLIIAGIHEQYIYAHGNILALRSDYFAKLLAPDWKEDQKEALLKISNSIHKNALIKNIIKLPDIEPQTMLIILNYLYTCDINIPHDSILSVASSADILNLSHLKETCLSYFEMSILHPSNALQYFLIAHDLKRTQGMIKALQMVIRNFDLAVISGQKTLQSMDRDVIRIILSGTLFTDSDRWKIFIFWIKAQQSPAPNSTFENGMADIKYPEKATEALLDLMPVMYLYGFTSEEYFELLLPYMDLFPHPWKGQLERHYAIKCKNSNITNCVDKFVNHTTSTTSLITLKSSSNINCSVLDLDNFNYNNIIDSNATLTQNSSKNTSYASLPRFLSSPVPQIHAVSSVNDFFLPSSNILSKMQMKDFAKQIGAVIAADGICKTQAWKSLFQASLHGFSNDRFYERCCEQTNLLVLLKIKGSGGIAGGYVNHAWKNHESSKDTKSFLFKYAPSMMELNTFPVKPGMKAIHKSGFSIGFGEGARDLNFDNNNAISISFYSYEGNDQHDCLISNSLFELAEWEAYGVY